MSRPFVKMNGLGNDFVIVVDPPAGSSGVFAPAAAEARAIADRADGIGCDQILVLSGSERADIAMRVWNADGGEVGACGNGARCAAWLAMEATGRPMISLEIAGGVVEARRRAEGAVAVDLGPPRLDWRDIPLAAARDTRGFVLAAPGEPGGDLGFASAVSMGNPHLIFFVDDCEAVDAAGLGSVLERHPLFPQRTNVGFAQVSGPDELRLRVWERGAGLTRACGTGACAAAVAAVRRGLTGRVVRVVMDGGELTVKWRRDDHVVLTGPVNVERSGRLPDPGFVP